VFGSDVMTSADAIPRYTRETRIARPRQPIVRLSVRLCSFRLFIFRRFIFRLSSYRRFIFRLSSFRPPFLPPVSYRPTAFSTAAPSSLYADASTSRNGIAR
jgi:hypothetical protein